MSFCKDCVTGMIHEGEPQGREEHINGVHTYIAIPLSEYDKSKAILFLPDLFGISHNSKLLVSMKKKCAHFAHADCHLTSQSICIAKKADNFAQHGFQTYIPDYLIGKPFEKRDDEPFDTGAVMKWLGEHTQERTRPPLDRVIDGLKSKGIIAFAATGYCFGGRYVFDLAFDGVVKVASASHPSLLKVPEDLDLYKEKASSIPLHINTCEFDEVYGPEMQAIGDGILGGGKFETEKYKRDCFAECHHGFAVRGDLNKPVEKAAKEKAFSNTVHWFERHL